MDYQKIHDNIIANAKVRNSNRNDGYVERHHIIPKCLGGDNSKDNLVFLTAREHYLCHKLLFEIHPNNSSLYFAYHKMALSIDNCKLKNE